MLGVVLQRTVKPSLGTAGGHAKRQGRKGQGTAHEMFVYGGRKRRDGCRSCGRLQIANRLIAE